MDKTVLVDIASFDPKPSYGYDSLTDELTQKSYSDATPAISYVCTRIGA